LALPTGKQHMSGVGRQRAAGLAPSLAQPLDSLRRQHGRRTAWTPWCWGLVVLIVRIPLFRGAGWRLGCRRHIGPFPVGACPRCLWARRPQCSGDRQRIGQKPLGLKFFEQVRGERIVALLSDYTENVVFGIGGGTPSSARVCRRSGIGLD